MEFNIETAINAYQNIRKAVKKYNETHREIINERRRMHYKANNPNPRAIGRPRKQPVANDKAAGGYGILPTQTI